MAGVTSVTLRLRVEITQATTETTVTPRMMVAKMEILLITRDNRPQTTPITLVLCLHTDRNRRSTQALLPALLFVIIAAVCRQVAQNTNRKFK